MDYLVAISTLLGSLFTGASVLIALHAYRSSEAKSAFAQARLHLLDVRHLLGRVDSLLCEALFVEIGTKISEHLRSAFRDPITPEAVLDFLENKNNHNAIAQYIYLALGESRAVQKITELQESLEKVPFEFREQLPVLSSAVQSLVSQLSVVISRLMNPGAYNTSLNDPDHIKNALHSELVKLPDSDAIFREIVVFVMANGLCNSHHWLVGCHA